MVSSPKIHYFKEKMSLTETFLGGTVRLTCMQSIGGEIKIFVFSVGNASTITAFQASLHALLNFSLGKEKLQYFSTRDVSRSEESMGRSEFEASLSFSFKINCWISKLHIIYKIQYDAIYMKYNYNYISN
jgi:hypothetical protein